MKKIYVLMYGSEILGMFSTKEKAISRAKELLIKHFTTKINEYDFEFKNTQKEYFGQSDYISIKEVDGEID